MCCSCSWGCQGRCWEGRQQTGGWQRCKAICRRWRECGKPRWCLVEGMGVTLWLSSSFWHEC